MNWRARLGLALALAFGLTTGAQAAHIYTITQSASQLNLTVTGSAFEGALTVTEQQAAAITRYNGTLAVNFPAGPASGGSIAFPGGSAAAAVNPTGAFSIPLQFTPNVNGGAGSAPANYGVNLNAPVNIDLPPIPIPDVGEIDLGTLTGVNLAVAIRNLVLDVDSTGALGIGPGTAFDANGTNLSIQSGFADINGALVLHQSSLLTKAAVFVALQALVATIPDLGLTVSTPNLFSLDILLGIGTRLDLADVGGLAVPNTAAADGSVSYNLPSGSSTLILPVLMQLPSLGDFGIPPEILDLQLSLSGQIQATAVVPEPSTIVLALCGVVGLIGFARRRKP